MKRGFELRLPAWAGVALAGALALTGCINSGDDDDLFTRQDGPRSLSKGRFQNSSLGYAFAHPEPWTGGLVRLGDVVGYWSSAGDTDRAYVLVYECDVDSAYICKVWRDSDREYGNPGTQTRQGVEVIVDVSADTVGGRVTRLQRTHFQRGNTLVMFLMEGRPKDFTDGGMFRRLDSSLTFF